MPGGREEKGEDCVPKNYREVDVLLSVWELHALKQFGIVAESWGVSAGWIVNQRERSREYSFGPCVVVLILTMRGEAVPLSSGGQKTKK